MTDPTNVLRDPLADPPATQFAPDRSTPPAPASSDVSPPSSLASSVNPWWRIGDFGVLGLWIVVVSFTIQYHEKWADEAQAWLIARDLGLRTIWFHELRYEGSPGLWHTILWLAQRVFHARYGAIGYIGAVCATAGVALLIFKAPFPRTIRWPLAFTYFMVYQYAVIARPYTLLPLLAFAAAILFRDIKHPERMTVVLVLLANLTLHGTIIAGCIGLGYLREAIKSWRILERPVRNRYLISIAVMALTFVFLLVILMPTKEYVAGLVRGKELAQMPRPTPAQKLVAGVSGAFLDYSVPSFLFIALAGAWCFLRGRLLTFALPVALTTLLYAAVHGLAHHHGTIFVAAITGLWIAWPDPEEKNASNKRERWALQGMTALLLCLCAVNIWDSAVVIRREYLYPYSGAEDAAKYLKSVGADRGPIFGFTYGMAGVQAYFDHNILANIPTTYSHHGLPVAGERLDVDELERVNPDYVVMYSNVPQVTLDVDGPVYASLGYEMVHFSDGYYFYKSAVYEREAYLIFHRTRPGPAR